MLPFELTKDTPYLALSGELWSVFYEYFNRNWSCYKGFLLYSSVSASICLWLCSCTVRGRLSFDWKYRLRGGVAVGGGVGGWVVGGCQYKDTVWQYRIPIIKMGRPAFIIIMLILFLESRSLHCEALMHVGIANPQWRGKRPRHSRHMRNLQFYVSIKRPTCEEAIFIQSL